MRSGTAGVLALTLLVRFCAAQAQDGIPPAVKLDPVVAAELDGLLSREDWNGLGAAVTQTTDPEHFRKAMDWLANTTNAGGPYFLSLLYSRDLWTMATAGGGDAFRDDSAVTLLYTMALIRIDGPACADGTAPSHRFDQTLQTRASTFVYLKGLSADRKESLIRIAEALEKRTASLRQPHDEMLCRGGLAEMQAGSATGREQEVPTPAGGVGRTINVTAPPGWKPSYLPKADYKAKQDQMRATLHDWLAAIAK